MLEGARPRMRRGFWFGSELARDFVLGFVRREVMVCIVSWVSRGGGARL